MATRRTNLDHTLTFNVRDTLRGRARLTMIYEYLEGLMIYSM